MNSPLGQKSYRTYINNIGWNLFGQLAPMVAALVSIPLLIKGLGIDRFGVVTIAWMLIGYFSLFDLGIGRALTQIISEKIALNNHNAIPPLMWTGLSIMFVMGIAACLLMMGFSDWIIYNALKIPEELRSETKNSLFLLAASIPLVLIATGLRGVLEALHEFKAVNLVKVPLGVLTFVAPLFVLPFSNSLVFVLLSLFLVRVMTFTAFIYLCKRAMSNFNQITFSKKVIPELLRFGGWMTVSNVVSPIMVQMDRFAIGVMMSMAAVAYYATPFEMVTKVLLVPAAIAGVCFPQFAQLIAAKDTAAAMALYMKSCKYVFFITLPIIIILIFFASFILKLWLGNKFEIESTYVFQILAVGVLFNGVANIPFACIQGAGRSDLTAKVHLVELFIYVPLLYFAVLKFGIIGAATVWSIRVICDGFVLHNLLQKIIFKTTENNLSVNI